MLLSVVVGGFSLSGVQASAELYDPATGRCTPTGSERFFCGVKNGFNEPSAHAEVYTPGA